MVVLAACFLPWMTACVVVNAPDEQTEDKQPTQQDIYNSWVNVADSLQVSIDVRHMLGIWRYDYHASGAVGATSPDAATDFAASETSTDTYYLELRSDMTYTDYLYYMEEVEPGYQALLLREQEGKWSLLNSQTIVLEWTYTAGKTEKSQHTVHMLQADRMVLSQPYKTGGGEDYVSYMGYTRIDELPKKPANPTGNISKYQWELESDSLITYKSVTSILGDGSISSEWVRQGKKTNQMPAKCVFAVDDKRTFLFIRSDKGEDLCVCGLYEQENAFPAALDFYVSPAKDDLNLKWETLRFAPSWKNLDKALFLAYAYDFDKGYMYHYYCHVQKKM